MSTQELRISRARALHAALMEVFIRHPGGEANPAALARVARLCQAAPAVVQDLECREAIRGVGTLAKLLFAADCPKDVTSGVLRGPDALRFQIFNALSTFRGRLQVLASLPPSRPEVPALAAQTSLRVLVVEDNVDSAESLRKLLELSGYAVTVAYSGREGLEAAQRTPPDVVLCDIGLPDRDGYAVAAALRADPATARARLIAVTAYGSDEDRQRARAAGFQLHLVKPVKPEALLQELSREAVSSSSQRATSTPMKR